LAYGQLMAGSACLEMVSESAREVGGIVGGRRRAGRGWVESREAGFGGDEGKNERASQDIAVRDATDDVAW